MANTNIHREFILAPITNIFKEGLAAINSLGDGIEITALKEYFLQSLFLRMTGAQEQKLKCIGWDLASNDYAFRYKYLKSIYKTYGEHSTYDAKKGVYNDIIDVVHGRVDNFKVDNFWDSLELPKEEESIVREQWYKEVIEPFVTRVISSAKSKTSFSQSQKDSIKETQIHKKTSQDKLHEKLTEAKKIYFVKEWMSAYKDLIKKSSLSVIMPKKYESFLGKMNILMDGKALCIGHNLLSNGCVELYEKEVYEFRNRCAHNLTSYQMHLPNLQVLAYNKEVDNYFIRFWLIILIDNILMLAYDYYDHLPEIV